jgi:hypothetical protein
MLVILLQPRDLKCPDQHEKGFQFQMISKANLIGNPTFKIVNTDIVLIILSILVFKNR